MLLFSGNNIVVEDTPFGRLGLTVCYDLRFPELYQQLRFQHQAQVHMGFKVAASEAFMSFSMLFYFRAIRASHLPFQVHMQVLLVPAAFTRVTGEAHWEILLRARAIETQCYVRQHDPLFILRFL